jgi:outer membrane biosynthesis protein TonB
MRIGFAISIVLHAALLAWVLVSIRSGREFKKPEIVPVALDIITADELARMKQGDQKAKDKPADAVKDQTGPAPKEQPKPKPVAAAPPPPPPPPPPRPQPQPPPHRRRSPSPSRRPRIRRSCSPR